MASPFPVSLRLRSIPPVAVALFAFFPAALGGQAVGADISHRAEISGFQGLGWGADSARIVALKGRPDTVRAIEALDARALVYSRDTIAGTVGSLGFLVRSGEGLVRVLYLAEYGGGGSCLALYQRLRDAVGGMYPAAVGRERMYNSAEDLEFCTAFQLGRAGARRVWRDAAEGGRAWVALDRRAGVVRVSVESPGYVEERVDGSGG